MIKDGVLGRISIRIQLLARIDTKQTFVVTLYSVFASLSNTLYLFCALLSCVAFGPPLGRAVRELFSSICRGEYVSKCTRVGNEQKRLAALYVKTTYNLNIRTGPEW